MSNNLKRDVIHNLAEQGIPANYDPWEAVKFRLEKNQAGQKRMRQMSKNVPIKFGLTKRHAIILAMLLVFLAGMVFVLTPQGQVTAKNLFQFFRRGNSNELPLPTGLPTEPLLPTRTPVPTQVVGLQAVSTEELPFLYTPTAEEITKQGTLSQGLTIAQAQELAQFAIRTPRSLPSGYRLADVWFNSKTRAVQQFYKYFPYQAGELFVLTQELSQPTETIGQSAEIKQIQVGDILVEAISGFWFSADGSNQLEWIEDASSHTFRWQQDGFTFTLQFMIGDTFSPAYLTEDDMQAVVEIIVGNGSELPTGLNLNNLKSVEEVEQVAGFQLLAPTILPEGFVLERAVYEPENQRAVFIYRPKDTGDSMNYPSLTIFEILKADNIPSATYPEEFPPEAIEQVKIGQSSAIIQRGTIVDGKYDSSSGLSLHWETNTLSITINYWGSTSHPAQLDKVDMIKIGEGLQ
jgi:hypothetical protein